VDEAVDQNDLHRTRGSRAFLPCRAAVVPQDPHLRVRDHPPVPQVDGSRWRKLNPGQQALLVLVYLRKGETFADLAAGFEVGTTTAWRYVEETTALLAARAPKLRQAIREAKRAGWAYVVLDGTLIPIDRVAADRPFYSGKHKKHGMNLQAAPVTSRFPVPGRRPRNGRYPCPAAMQTQAPARPVARALLAR
jgi:Helix-turn-helix of DDE superfamily endonuclease